MHTLEQLLAFTLVYEQGSYSAAAKLLGKARTTVREHVMAYEDSLGYELFSIEGKRAVPTSHARQLYFHAKIVERQNRELYRLSQALFDREVERLTFVYDVCMPLQLAASIEQQVAESPPGLPINWLHRTRSEAIEMLLDGSADFAVMPNKGRMMAEAELNWRFLGNIRISGYKGATTHLSCGDTVSIPELQNHTQYITENLMALELDFVRVSPQLQVVSNNDLLCHLLQSGGWAAMPDHYMEPYVNSGKVEAFELIEASQGYSLGLNVFFAPGKDKARLNSNIIRWMEKYAAKCI